MSKLKNFTASILFIILYVIAKLIYQPSFSLDEDYPGLNYLTLILMFSMLMTSLISWGRVLSELIEIKEDKPFFAYLLGTIFLIFSSFILSALPIRSASIFILVLFIGPFLKNWFGIKCDSLIKKYEVIDIIAFLPLITLVVLVGIQSLFFNIQLDTYYYHLFAPKFWWLEGSFSLPKHHPMALQAGYWESLYFWGMSLFSKGKELDLISIQLFSQIIHMGIGFVGTLFALFTLFKRFCNVNGVIFWASAISIAYYHFFWTAWVAKNDYGSAFFIFAAIAILFDQLTRDKFEKSKLSLVGVCMGIAFFIKPTTVFLSIFSILIFVFFLRKQKEDQSTYLGVLIIAGLISIAPMMIRNGALTGNPFFPFLNSIFESPWLTQSWQDFYSVLESGRNISFTQMLKVMFQLMSSSWIYFTSLLAVAVFFLRKENFLMKLFMISIFSLIFYVFKTKDMALSFHQIRSIAPIIILGMMTGMISTFVLIRMYIDNIMVKYAYCVVLFIVFLLQGHIPWKNALAISQMPNPKETIANVHFGGQCKKWLRNQTSLEGKLLSLGDDDLYFNQYENYSIANHDPEVDRALYDAKDIPVMLGKLKELNIRYLYSSLKTNRTHFTKYSKLISRYLLDKNQGVLVRADDCYIIDLKQVDSY